MNNDITTFYKFNQFGFILNIKLSNFQIFSVMK